MRIVVLELPATWDTPARALADLAGRLATVAPGDLVLLPEASLCGYVSPTGDCDRASACEPIDGPIATRCAALARAHAITLVAPLALREGAHAYNAMAAFAPDGTLAALYRKHHPWFPETWATPGPQPPSIFTVARAGAPPLAVTIAICFDLHFLPAESADVLRAAELLLFPSAWVERPDLRVDRLTALARGFDLAIANANWAPGVVRIAGQGGSCLIAAGGGVVARAPRGGHASADLDALVGVRPPPGP